MLANLLTGCYIIILPVVEIVWKGIVRGMNNYIYKAYKAGKLLVQLKKGHDKRKERVRKDLERYGNEVLNSEEMQKAFDQTHHRWATVGEHTLRVAGASLIICYALKKMHVKVNVPAVVIGALCHDLGMLGRHEKYDSLKNCNREHPIDSVYVAKELLEDLPEITEDIIERHMWPLGGCKAPNTIEGAVVSIADKYAAVKDLVKGSDVKHTGVKNYVLDKKDVILDAVFDAMRKESSASLPQ